VGTDLAELLLEIEDTRERAQKARRLTRGLSPNHVSTQSLRNYAEELDAKAEKLEAQAAVLKQSATQTVQEGDPQQSIAALKPPIDPEPEA
jgi:hypothetical protein